MKGNQRSHVGIVFAQVDGVGSLVAEIIHRTVRIHAVRVRVSVVGVGDDAIHTQRLGTLEAQVKYNKHIQYTH